MLVVAQHRRSVYTPSVALYAGLIARALGARAVHLVDSRPWVWTHAERLGLHAMRPAELRGAQPAPLVVHISAVAKGLAEAISATAPDGICSSSGGLHRTARIPTGLMYSRNTTLVVGRTHARAVIPKVLELMADGRLHPETVTTRVASIDDAPRTLHDHLTDDAVKTVLVEA